MYVSNINSDRDAFGMLECCVLSINTKKNAAMQSTLTAIAVPDYFDLSVPSW